MKKILVNSSTKKVVNIIELDSNSNWKCPDRHIVIDYGGIVDIGWDWDGENFINPTIQNVVLTPVPQSITRRQCAIELRERTMITAQEALDMTKYGEVPIMIANIFSQMSDSERIKAETDFAADTYMRNNPLLLFIMTEAGSTEEDIDQFFRDAYKR